MRTKCAQISKCEFLNSHAEGTYNFDALKCTHFPAFGLTLKTSTFPVQRGGEVFNLQRSDKKYNKRDTKYYKKVGAAASGLVRQNLPQLYKIGLFGLFGLGLASNSSIFRTNPQTFFGAVQFCPNGFMATSPRQNRTKTERFRESFDFDQALSGTYDDCRPSRSISIRVHWGSFVVALLPAWKDPDKTGRNPDKELYVTHYQQLTFRTEAALLSGC
jgi:hypothetical protein